MRGNFCSSALLSEARGVVGARTDRIFQTRRQRRIDIVRLCLSSNKATAGRMLSLNGRLSPFTYKTQNKHLLQLPSSSCLAMLTLLQRRALSELLESMTTEELRKVRVCDQHPGTHFRLSICSPRLQERVVKEWTPLSTLPNVAQTHPW